MEIENIEIVGVNEFTGKPVEKRCILCGESFFEAEDPYEEGETIIVSPCGCYECCEEGEEEVEDFNEHIEE